MAGVGRGVDEKKRGFVFSCEVSKPFQGLNRKAKLENLKSGKIGPHGGEFHVFLPGG